MSVLRPTGWIGTATGLLKQAVFVFLGLTVLFPFYYMIANALKTQDDYYVDPLGLPDHATARSFVALFRDSPLGTWYLNSVVLTGASVVLATAVAALAAFSFARYRFRGGTVLYRLLISLMVVPPIVLVLPLFVLAVRLGMINTRTGAIVVYVGILLPFSIFLLTSFFRTIPSELIDAARIDGASSLGILVRVVAPLSAPALVTLAIVNALFVWNDLLIALILLQDNGLHTLQIGVSQFRSRYSFDVPLMMAGLALASWPAIVAYLLGQRYFTRGLLAGATKG